MTRPHIEFVQSQALPWKHEAEEEWFSGVQTKLLSEDLDSGASSMLVQYPAGW